MSRGKEVRTNAIAQRTRFCARYRFFRNPSLDELFPKGRASVAKALQQAWRTRAYEVTPAPHTPCTCGGPGDTR